MLRIVDENPDSNNWVDGYVDDAPTKSRAQTGEEPARAGSSLLLTLAPSSGGDAA